MQKFTYVYHGQSQGLPVSPAEFGVEGEFAWLPCEDALAALTAVLAAYMLASSWNLPMFFLYLILLFPNQFETWANKQQNVDYLSCSLSIQSLTIFQGKHSEKWGVFSLAGLNGMSTTAESLCQRKGLHRLVLWIHISARMEWLPITVSLCHPDCNYHQNSHKHQSVNIR